MTDATRGPAPISPGELRAAAEGKCGFYGGGGIMAFVRRDLLAAADALEAAQRRVEKLEAVCVEFGWLVTRAEYEDREAGGDMAKWREYEKLDAALAALDDEGQQ